MPTKLERERKFLVKFPKSWIQLSELFDHIVDVRRISQCYLTPEKNQQAVRIRKTISGLTGEEKVEYHFNQKKPIETGVHQEKEHTISKEKYQSMMKQADPKKCEVQKTRFVFDYHDQVFELDLFKGHLKGLAILEIELPDINDTVELPSFLPSIKEITDDKRYSNYSLADKR
jgi:CYTH domain-containing protein